MIDTIRIICFIFNPNFFLAYHVRFLQSFIIVSLLLLQTGRLKCPHPALVLPRRNDCVFVSTRPTLFTGVLHDFPDNAEPILYECGSRFARTLSVADNYIFPPWRPPIKRHGHGRRDAARRRVGATRRSKDRPRIIRNASRFRPYL